MQRWIFSIITPVFSVTWSFRIPSKMLMCCTCKSGSSVKSFSRVSFLILLSMSLALWRTEQERYQSKPLKFFDSVSFTPSSRWTKPNTVIIAHPYDKLVGKMFIILYFHMCIYMLYSLSCVWWWLYNLEQNNFMEDHTLKHYLDSMKRLLTNVGF